MHTRRREVTTVWTGSLIVAMTASLAAQGPSVDTTQLRTITNLDRNWQFIQHDQLTDSAALQWKVTGAQSVTLPHTWNAEDAASLRATGYKRGRGWYRLEFATPASGARHWLEIGAASLVADVWLNGQKLGQHKGGFTAFRFDITERLNRSGPNILLVECDNSEPQEETDLTAIAPLGGDFNVSGGLYRHVHLISTAAPVHFDLGDMGGPGVYATTTSIAQGAATVNVRTKLKSNAATAGNYVVRVSLLDDRGGLAGTAERTVLLPPGAAQQIDQNIQVKQAHLWQGTEDPYLYRLVAELATGGKPVDNLVQHFGIRQMRFHPDSGFFLNAKYMRLRGVAMHQDFLGKAWATSPEDMDQSLALIKEIGANTLRLGHYPFGPYVLERISQMGLVAWAETALGLGTTVRSCSQYPATAEFVANARQQLQEMIRQQYNHAAVAVWSIGNESAARQLNCDPPYDNVRPVLRDLHRLAKSEDPVRASAYAEYGHGADRKGVYATEEIADVFASNRYFLWYTPEFEQFGPLLDSLHALTPKPLGITEYGAGAAITHHTDNPLGGRPEVRSAPAGQVSYQAEEYAAYAHEQNYRVLSSKRYLWGTFVWNMFDFGSGHRNEGDVLGVNTKGLVTFDRKTRKDPFYFYKANWTTQPVTYIVGRRYTDRAYALADLKVYSNADSVALSLNGKRLGLKRAADCPQRSCVFQKVQLSRGDNRVRAVGYHGAAPIADSVLLSYNAYNDRDVNIAAGRLATGYVSSQGIRFGSDNFFSGGSGEFLGGTRPPSPQDLVGTTTLVQGTADPFLYTCLRRGSFSYNVPLPNGSYEVTLGFAEPDSSMAAGGRSFNVSANGEPKLANFDVLQAAGGRPRAAVIRSFPVVVSSGNLRLDFKPVKGEAVVSNIMIRSR